MFLTLTPNDIFCSLDDDSWFLKEDALSIAVKYMCDHADVGAIAFDILSPDDGSTEVMASFEAVETNMYIGCGHLLRTDIVKKMGGYISNPGYYGGEEKDLCIRLMNAGFKIIKLRGLYVWHDKTSLARNQAKQHRSGVCNDLVFAYRRVPGWLLIPVLGYKLFSHLKFSIFYKQASLVIPCLCGFGDFFSFLFKSNKQRDAVSYSTYQKFRSLN
jgi:GT2 family glycosyltransferase